MSRAFYLIAFCWAVGGATAQDPMAEVDEQKLHGGFTGEVKPVIYVSDVEKSAPFYRDVLGFDFEGFDEAAANPYYAEMIAGRLKFGLHEPTAPRDEDRVGQLRLYFRVLDLDDHRQRVLARGANATEIVRRSWMDFFVVRDLDGNDIVFAITDAERHKIQPWSR